MILKKKNRNKIYILTIIKVLNGSTQADKKGHKLACL